jgi:hypothetical protein
MLMCKHRYEMAILRRPQWDALLLTCAHREHSQMHMLEQRFPEGPVCLVDEDGED